MMSDPVDILKSSNPHITQQQINMYKKQQGLDKPTVVWFFYRLNDVLKGDFGTFETNRKNTFPQYPLLMIFLASLLSGFAAIFAIKKPFVSMIIFTIAAISSATASTYWFSFILLLLAVFSYFAYKELKKKPLVAQP
jgi:ABC-type dipeptide/oligopeptide/nickel transport system permease component